MRTPTVALVKHMVDQGQFDEEDFDDLLDDLAEEMDDGMDFPDRGRDRPRDEH